DEHAGWLIPVLSQPWFRQLRHFAFGGEEALLARLFDRVELSNLTSVSLAIERTRDESGRLLAENDVYRRFFSLVSTSKLRALRIPGPRDQFTAAFWCGG